MINNLGKSIRRTTFTGMEKVCTYYKEKITDCEHRVANLKRRIHLIGTVRLALFLGVFGAVYIMRDSSVAVLVGVVSLFVIPFVALMVYHTRLFNKKTYYEILARLCGDELKGLNYDFSVFDGMPEKQSGEHLFSLDLDLFGDKSFIQSINRTVTGMGRERLAAWMQTPLTDKVEIVKRQKAVEELASQTIIRQHFFVSGSLKQGGRDDYKKLTGITSEVPVYFINSPLWRVFVWLFPVVWTILFVCLAIGVVPFSVISIGILVSITVAYSQAKKTVALHHFVNKLELLLGVYSDLLYIMENAEFQSVLLKERCSVLTGSQRASVAIKELSKAIGALDQRFSFAGLLFQIFTLRDVRTSMRIEHWMKQYKTHLGEWFNVLADFDALCSMGGFAFNHPYYIYPEITDTYFRMEGKQVGHPLLNRAVCVKNDISIHKSPWFLIITGANMAGKSTYLRTVGLNYILACCGMPVCAESMTVYPARLVTSLRTSDNLMNNESYFFAELKRLKMIIDLLQDGEELFIILDEILKGTNSVDKQKGSLALMKQLVNLKTCGIIATHDLLLGNLEAEFPEQIRNYRFEADIKDDELTFSYQLHDGVAKNMNACFLMQKMGITV